MISSFFFRENFVAQFPGRVGAENEIYRKSRTQFIGLSAIGGWFGSRANAYSLFYFVVLQYDNVKLKWLYGSKRPAIRKLPQGVSSTGSPDTEFHRENFFQDFLKRKTHRLYTEFTSPVFLAPEKL